MGQTPFKALLAETPYSVHRDSPTGYRQSLALKSNRGTPDCRFLKRLTELKSQALLVTRGAVMQQTNMLAFTRQRPTGHQASKPQLLSGRLLSGSACSLATWMYS